MRQLNYVIWRIIPSYLLCLMLLTSQNYFFFVFHKLAWATSRYVGCGVNWCDKEFGPPHPWIPGETIVTCDYGPTYVTQILILPHNKKWWKDWVCPIRTVIMRVICKIGLPRGRNPICDLWIGLLTEVDDTESCDQLVKSMTNFERQTSHWLSFFTTNKS